MINEETIEKAYVREDSQTTVVCPQCNLTKMISVEKFREKKHVVTMHCKCGHNFKLQLEFRKYYRKETSLDGCYTMDRPGVGGGRALILNLSLGGASIEVRSFHGIEVGDKGKLVFTLDNRKKSVIDRRMIVRSVSNRVIGCEFIEDPNYQKELGFYLLP